MKLKHKKLLLADLCSRLPYGVKCDVGDDKPWTLMRVEIDNYNGHLFDFYDEDGNADMQVYTSEVKPYLFPFSSLTSKQEKELNKILNNLADFVFHVDELLEPIQMQKSFPFEVEDFFNRNHIDYRGLIPMGIAKDATNLNIY